MKFINIIGTTGSGKSTFARQLAKNENYNTLSLIIYFGWMIGKNHK
jgi:adenylate kinase family enzyme